MTRHLLDTDGVIDVLKGVIDTITLRQSLIGQANTLATCDVVLGEVFAGLHPQDEARAEQFLSTLEYLSASEATGRQAGR